MPSQILGAAILPGLPHILSGSKSPAWNNLHLAMQSLAQQINEKKPDVIVMYSTQWLSVLGTSFQIQENPKGTHVDDNWYELGDLPFDFKVDSLLGNQFASSVRNIGFPTKAINYEEFPIDTGSIVALRYLNSKNQTPVSIVSSWAYADKKASYEIGKAMRDVILLSGKKVFVVASSLLSTRFFTNEIDPKEDHISQKSDDEWNQKILGLFESGNLSGASDLAVEFSKNAPTDMQLNAVHWLSGILDQEKCWGQILAYGPQWGTGAAVVNFHVEK